MAMVAQEPQVPPMVNVDKLSHEIFPILKAQFLFGYPPNNKPKQAAPPALAGDVGRVHILSVDAASPTDGLLSTASLARLESALRCSSSLPDARLPDLFYLAAGSGHGGLLVSLLFACGPDASPLFSAADAFAFLADLPRPRKSRFSLLCGRGGLAGWVVAKSIFASSPGLSLALQTNMQEAAQGELANARAEQQLLQPRITQTPNNNREEEYESRCASDNMEGSSEDDLDADHRPRKKRCHPRTRIV